MAEDSITDPKNKYLDDLHSDYRYSIDKTDYHALYISSGALAISLTFLKDIVPFKDAIWLFLFYIALIMFVLTILLGFLAHYLSSQLILSQYYESY
jgi:hypothetical protein